MCDYKKPLLILKWLPYDVYSVIFFVLNCLLGSLERPRSKMHTSTLPKLCKWIGAHIPLALELKKKIEKKRKKERKYNAI